MVTKKKVALVLKQKQKYKKIGYISLITVGVIILAGLVVRLGDRNNDIPVSGDLLISKSEITSTATYYPYNAEGTYMEVIAVKAEDGSIRTAFNTCQVCFDSGRGYYEQQGNLLICQNCGNRFEIEDVEIVRGGCNPVPIMSEDKTDNEEAIIISGDFLVQNVDLFVKWK